MISDIVVGNAGYAYAVSSQGDLIAHPDISLVFQKCYLKELVQVKAALHTGHRPLPNVVNLQGARVAAAYAQISELDCAVLFECPIVEANHALYLSILRTGLLLLTEQRIVGGHKRLAHPPDTCESDE